MLRQVARREIFIAPLLAAQPPLPWFCLARSSYQARPLTCLAAKGGSHSITCRPRPPKWVLESATKRRHLATAAAETQFQGDHHVPFEGTTSGTSIYPSSRENLSDIRPINTSSPIIVNQPPPTALKRWVKSMDGISGDIWEIQLTLEACLQVRRFEMAAALIRRLSSVFTPQAAELPAAHEKYIAAFVDYIRENRTEDNLKSLQTWFEAEMKLKGIEPTPATYALMLKASMLILHGAKLDRAIRRYMDMAARAQRDLEVLNLPILSDSELVKITKVCPTDFFPADGDSSLLSADDESSTQTVPKVRPVHQKGLGLDSLKRALSLFSDVKVTEAHNDEEAAMARQKLLEENALNAAIDRWREEDESLQKKGLNRAFQNRPLGAMMWEWYLNVKKELTEELKKINESEGKPPANQLDQDRVSYGPILRLLPVDRLAAITVITGMGILSTKSWRAGIPIAHIALKLASALQEEIRAESVKEGIHPPYWERASQGDRAKLLSKLVRKRQRPDPASNRLSESSSIKPQSSPTLATTSLAGTWTDPVRVRVGVALLSILLRVATIRVKRIDPETNEHYEHVAPAFSHAYIFRAGRNTGSIIPHASILKKLASEPVKHTLAKHLPMVVKPKEWKGFEYGGFLRYAMPVMRIKGAERAQQHYVEAAVEKGDMDQVFAGLNVLSKTAWKINRPVFDVMLEAWNSGEPIADISPADPEVNIPPEPGPLADLLERRQWLKAFKEAHNKKNGYHSERCYQNFQMELARAYLNETFYYPHNIDFRGRAYPLSPYLNHLGADNCRGLLMFAKGKELGAAGLDWLKVHLANVYGFDKASIQRRKEFTMEHLSDVMDSATRPLTGDRWWLTAENPWQCLATCIELKNALDLPDPTRFVSRLPIHQDGTCNGLQHYAALGGDTWGAKQVNLEPSDAPADIYSAVANLVREDLRNGIEKDEEWAKLLEKHITRKVVKQTVMTNVYGVTMNGAMAQVRKQLVDLLPNLPESVASTHGRLSLLVAKKVFKALSTMFSGTHKIQWWFTECAARISESLTPEQMDRIEGAVKGEDGKADGRYRIAGTSLKDDFVFTTPVIWTTPLRMPVVQPYRDAKRCVIDTRLQKVSIMSLDHTDPVNKRKQMAGFPPNFIHSLDATHMLLSALRCDELGLTFAAVHDSFWTHAVDVDVMNEVLRDAFIRIHSEDILIRLAEEFDVRYKENMYLAKVPRDTAVADKIVALRRSAKRQPGVPGGFRTSELVQERRRYRLLQSNDPKDREEGRKMVTPASIYEQALADEPIMADVPKKGQQTTKQRQTSSESTTTDTNIEQDEMVDLDDISIGSELDAMDEGVLDSVEAEGDDASQGLEAGDAGEEKPKAKGYKSVNEVRFWMRLKFPPVPERGNFDVSRLRNSLYFFS